MLALNLVGGCLLIAGGTALGWELAANLERRPDELREWLVALQALETEIAYGATPLPAALAAAAAASRGAARRACEACAAALHGSAGRPAADLWAEAVAVAAGRSPLQAEDVRALVALGSGLGGSDRGEQVKHLALCRSSLESELRRAEADRQRLARTYRWCGALGGAALALALI